MHVQYEQLKKQKAKKGGAKKKEDKEADASASKEVEDVKEEADAPEDDEAVEVEEEKTSPKKPHARQPSMSIQSKLRSESFRKESPLSPTGANDPLQRAEELERENKRLTAEKEEAEKRWRKLEDELQELREADGDDAGSKEHSAELEKLVRLGFFSYQVWHC